MDEDEGDDETTGVVGREISADKERLRSVKGSLFSSPITAVLSFVQPYMKESESTWPTLMVRKPS